MVMTTKDISISFTPLEPKRPRFETSDGKEGEVSLSMDERVVDNVFSVAYEVTPSIDTNIGGVRVSLILRHCISGDVACAVETYRTVHLSGVVRFIDNSRTLDLKKFKADLGVSAAVYGQ